MIIDICKKDIDDEIDLGSPYFTEYDNGDCFNCDKIGKCLELNLKIMYLVDCYGCYGNPERTCKSCISYLAYIIQHNKFDKLIRHNIQKPLKRFYRLNPWS